MIPLTVFPDITQVFEEPDILVTRITTDGHLGAPSMLGAAEQAVNLLEQRQDIYWINVFGKCKGVTVEGRQATRGMPVMRPYAYVGVIESFAMRALIGLMMRGLVLIGRMHGKSVFFKTEAEAREWIAEDRARRPRPVNGAQPSRVG